MARPLRLAALGVLVLLACERVAFCVRVALAGPSGLKAGYGIGADFIAFRAAGELLVERGPLAAYGLEAFVARTVLLAGVPRPGLLYHFPPTAYLLFGPLAALPYAVALWGFALGSLGALVLVARRAGLPWRYVGFLVLSPPVLFAFQQGQVTLLTTALLAGAALLAGTRPRAAGLCAALLVVKPQLGLLLPIFYLARGHRAAFAWAALLTGVLVAASVWLFGAEAWDTFELAARRLQDDALHATLGFTPTNGMAAVLPAMRAIGLPGSLAWCAQLAMMAAAAGAVWAARGRPAAEALAVICAGAPLVSPYGYLYDLVPSALAALILARAAGEAGWRAFEVVGLGVTVALFLLVGVTGAVSGPWPTIPALIVFALVARRFCAPPQRRAATTIASSAWAKRARSAFEKGGAPGPT